MKPAARKKRIIFLTLTITTGGAERTLFTILKYLDRDRFEPSVVYFDNQPGKSAEIPADVPLYLLQKKGLPGFIRIVFTLAFVLYLKIRPDIVVGFLDYPNTAALLAKIISPRKHRVILTVHNNLKQLYIDTGRPAWKMRLVKILYPVADRIIAVSKGVMNDLAQTFGLPEKKLLSIYNAIDIGFIREKASENISREFPPEKTKTIIACGRLSAQKNYRLLLQAFSIVVRQIPSRLCIIGRGSLKEELEEFACGLGLGEYVTFYGFVENPFALFARSDLFVLSSSYEGLGNVLIEAMICGIPVISTDCPFGPGEIIEHGTSGLLVPHEPLVSVKNRKTEPLIIPGDHSVPVTEMAGALLRILSDPVFAKRLAGEAEKRIFRFSAERIAGEYGKVFMEL